METKRCSNCNVIKEVVYFYRNKLYNDGFAYRCKECTAWHNSNYFKTKEGLVSRIYGAQKKSSSKRGHVLPNYSKKELALWIRCQSNFNELWNNWVRSNYETRLKPSVDRLDNSKGYSFDNIQLITWKENLSKESLCKERGVIQVKNGEEVDQYKSLKEAEGYTGVKSSDICQTCRGNYNSAGGYGWRYAE